MCIYVYIYRERERDAIIHYNIQITIGVKGLKPTIVIDVVKPAILIIVFSVTNSNCLAQY